MLEVRVLPSATCQGSSVGRATYNALCKKSANSNVLCLLSRRSWVRVPPQAPYAAMVKWSNTAVIKCVEYDADSNVKGKPPLVGSNPARRTNGTKARTAIENLEDSTKSALNAPIRNY